MKTKNLFKLILFTVYCVMISCSLINEHETQYIIIKQTYGRANPKMINAALLITEKDEIKNDREIFLPILKRKFGFPCGYDYDFLFWKNTDSLTHTVQVNKDCEEMIENQNDINDRITLYANQLRNAPTYFIYNLEIPATMEPFEVREKLKDSGLLLFFIENPSNRYKKIVFGYEGRNNMSKNEPDSIISNNEKLLVKTTERKIQNLIKQINKIQKTMYNTSPYYAVSMSYNSVYERVNLSFKNGSDLTKVIELIKNEGGKQINEFNPQVYYIQLLDRSNDIQVIQSKIKAYNFIKSVYIYPRTMYNPDYDGSLPEANFKKERKQMK